MSADSLLKRYKLIHESYMKQILHAVFTGPYKDILAFKGGTLAYLVYDLPRFSTDIDLDLLDPSQEQDLIDYMDTVLIWLGDSEKRLGRDLHRWRFRYDPNGRIIKIEINKRQNIQTHYEWIKIDNMSLQAQDLSSMVSNKLLALGNRRYNRDLYDIHFFLSQWYEFNESIIQDQEWVSLQDWITMILEMIPHYFQANTILHQLGEVLDDSKKPRVKTHLVDETIDLLKDYLLAH